MQVENTILSFHFVAFFYVLFEPGLFVSSLLTQFTDFMKL